MRTRVTAISARNRPSLLHPWSHLPSVAVLLLRRKLESMSVSLMPTVVPFDSRSCEARLSAMHEQFSNTDLWIHNKIVLVWLSSSMIATVLHVQ